MINVLNEEEIIDVTDPYPDSTSMIEERAEFEKCRSLAKQLYQQGCSREETFTRISQHLNYNDASSESIAEYFHRYASNPTFHEYRTLDKHHYILIEALFDVYQQMEHVIGVWSEQKIELLDGRYSIGMKEDGDRKPVSILLYDNFYGQTRELPIFVGTKKFHNYQLLPVDLEYSMLVLRSWQNYRPLDTLCLLRMDFLNGKCVIVSRRNINDHFHKVYIDSEDRRSFAFLFGYMNAYDLWFGKIRDGRLELRNGSFIFDTRNFVGGLKLTNGLMHAFALDQENDPEQPIDEARPKIAFCELLPVENGVVEYSSLFSVESKDGWCTKSFFSSSVYAWFGSTCYFAKRIHQSKYIIVGYDTEKREFSQAGNYVLEGISQMHIDQDGHLTALCTDEYPVERKKWMIYRIPLRQSDSLENLSLFEIRRQSMFFGSSLYDRLLQNLPKQVRPFDVLPLAGAKSRKPKRSLSENVERRRSKRLQNARLSL